jgi:hypothetical protein
VRVAGLRYHRRIVGALRAHDPDAAERAMLEHLDHVEQGLGPATGPIGAEARAGDAEPSPVGGGGR